MAWEAWVGLAAGGTLGIIIALVLIFCVCRKCLQKERNVIRRKTTSQPYLCAPCQQYVHSSARNVSINEVPNRLHRGVNTWYPSYHHPSESKKRDGDRNTSNVSLTEMKLSRLLIQRRLSFRSSGNIGSQSGEIEEGTYGVTVRKVIDASGGRLDIFGASLVIPKYALDREMTIGLGVFWDNGMLPELVGKQTILSPVIMCEPPRLKFNKPVSLSFPHGAVEPNEWILYPMVREGHIRENDSQWKQMHTIDSEVSISERRVSLELNHFTLYTLIGESRPGAVSTKLVHLMAFANTLERGRFFSARIFSMTGYHELEVVKKKAGDIGSSTDLIDITEMIIEDNDKDVMVELTELTHGWQVVGNTTEVLLFENVWHGVHSHCTFNIKHTDEKTSDIACEFHAYQSGNDNRPVKLKIAKTSDSKDDTDTKLPINRPAPNSTERERTTMVSSSATLQKEITSPLQGCPGDPLEDLILELTVLLDPINELQTDAGDWRDLAAKMGVNVAKLRWLDTQASKTRLLIEKWLSDKRTFAELRRVLIDIKRPDAAEEVLKRLPLLEPSPHHLQANDYAHAYNQSGYY